MELLNQPFNGQLGNRLVQSLESEEYDTLNVIVAFAKNSGVLRIREAVRAFRRRGGEVNIYVGIDLGGTSYEALTNLLVDTDNLYVIHTENGQTFHSKIYSFVGGEKAELNVGSHNLTGGGLWSNFESSIHLQVDAADDEIIGLQSNVDSYINDLRALGESFKRIDIQEDVDSLFANGYILKEVAQRIRATAPERRGTVRTRLFGPGYPARPPRISPAPKTPVTPTPKTATERIATNISFQKLEGQTIWFETRRMTGAARNILDLSMTSLVESGDPTGTIFDIADMRFMRGTVGFFGVNPTDVSKTLSININFEGTDYRGNIIKFPKGDKSNGTWRLQFRGVDSSGRTFNEALQARAEKFYLVEKVLAFTRVEDDYYFMTVFPASDLESFRDASTLVGRNGPNRHARLIGIL